MKLDEITQKNYYDDKTQLAFLSKTVFSNFTECEAQGVAIMKKQYSKFANDIALIHGNYVHSYFESEDAHKAFIDNEHNRDCGNLIGWTIAVCFDTAKIIISIVLPVICL